MKLPELGVKRPITTIMIFMAILLAGVVFYTQLQQDVLPDIEMPSLTVITVYPGASAEDVEQQVTKILEENLASTPNLKKITSKSKENVAFISLVFEWGADLSDVSNDVRDKLDIAKPSLPDNAHDPVMVKINSAMMPIVVYGIEAEESWAAADKIIDDMVLAPLKKVNGVGQVVLIGQPEREIQIKIDPFRLQAFRMTPNILATLLQAENVTIPGGTIKTGITDLAVRIPGEFKSLDELANITLMTFNGQPVRLKDVATITDGFKEKEVIYRSNQNRAAGMMIMKQSGANTLDVYHDISREMVEIQKKLPADVKVSELINSAESVTLALDNLKSTIGWAGLFVILVVIFFLRDIRSSLIVILTIPFSLIGTFGFMRIFGYTFNTFSGMALAIAIGMVVDNAIVVLENITKHIEKGER
ncbi:efflux RND transporter permease subunit, partial [bacterium]|nr:efflux RND transporter permease subunit [bacterium]